MCTLIIMLGVIVLAVLLIILVLLLLRLVFKPTIWRRTVSTIAPSSGWTEEYLYGSPVAEAEFIKQSMAAINAIQVGNRRRSWFATRIKRGLHAKGHAGISNAEFQVCPTIPTNLQVGFLQPGRKYKGVVRFSNASGVVQPDSVKDLRGLALRIIDDQGMAHDFLGTNAAASHTRDAVQFMDFTKAGAGSKLLFIPRLLWAFGLGETIRMLKTVSAQVSRPVVSLISERYWSRAPYAFGKTAVKFIISPSQSLDARLTTIRQISAKLGQPQGDNYLRDDLVARLKQGPVTFDFQVQLWVSDQATPIEDGSIEWKESISPPVTIGQLIIPQQDLTTLEAQVARSCVEMEAFNPWNTTDDFRPLGSMNRARKLVYQSSANLRHGRSAYVPKS